jgi:hypothetical protein
MCCGGKRSQSHQNGKQAIHTVALRFCARRLMKQYVQEMYVPRVAGMGSALSISHD